MGDNTLILGHRLSEWCGQAPALEEDIALANTALDLIGQTQMWLGLAAEIAGEGKTADDLAMRRDVWDFRNLLLVERPNVDFAYTTTRQFLFDRWHLPMLDALSRSSEPRVAAIAAKAVKEATYHAERSAELVVALGDGTAESHDRMQAALDALWPYTGEMFIGDDIDAELASEGIAPAPESLRDGWEEAVRTFLADATLSVPDSDFAHRGGRSGARHSEHLGHLLTQMQWLQRAYPDATW
ncbi:1,2-phenylacetyl-CoA epoxidase subunit PaaC [Jannaschia seosinensis]|nr:1,2-phenylacetyl-CoA epoxidase subunit PaaC [Jannaschia seosinensis]